MPTIINEYSVIFIRATTFSSFTCEAEKSCHPLTLGDLPLVLGSRLHFSSTSVWKCGYFFNLLVFSFSPAFQENRSFAATTFILSVAATEKKTYIPNILNMFRSRSIFPGICQKPVEVPPRPLLAWVDLDRLSRAL